jgi:hypothetical protein
MIFKKGDKVYDIIYGWGEVQWSDAKGSYPMDVKFKNLTQEYTLDGRLVLHSPTTLSFTEYTLNGFSQVRPKEPLPFKVGDVVYLSDKDVDYWVAIKLDEISIDSYSDCFVSDYGTCECLALENPLLLPDTKIYTKEDLI